VLMEHSHPHGVTLSASPAIRDNSMSSSSAACQMSDVDC